ncbi:hypothetical protein [Chelativorans sp. Marseille-P2723]|uniref:hypothetical protein n=1 Tax=Chelativorans sp. Marseille-P2723 TaxID=2709133 RepID=UPI00156E2BB2|nr:hypothetical protein [Chelativorans sp. Marseille-P2723]
MLRVKAIDQQGEDVFPANGILKAECFRHLAEAETIVKVARGKAAECLRRARQSRGTIHQNARQAGYAEGLQQFSAAIKNLDAARTQLRAELDGMLRQCLYSVLGYMPRKEWLSIALEALDDLRGDPEIAIMVHPANLRTLRSAISAARRRNKSLVPIKPEPNPQMGEDECLIYAGLEVIDASMPVLVEEAIAALKSLPVSSGDKDEGKANGTKA